MKLNPHASAQPAFGMAVFKNDPLGRPGVNLSDIRIVTRQFADPAPKAKFWQRGPWAPKAPGTKSTRTFYLTGDDTIRYDILTRRLDEHNTVLAQGQTQVRARLATPNLPHNELLLTGDEAQAVHRASIGKKTIEGQLQTLLDGLPARAQD